MSALTVFTLALLSAFLAPAGAGCGPDCEFRFCVFDKQGSLRKKGAPIRLRAPKTSLSSYVCNPNIPNLGRIHLTGEARVSKQGVPFQVPISSFDPPSSPVEPRFKRTFFGLADLPFLGGLQGISRRKAIGTQKDCLDDFCVILPIRSWDIKNRDGIVQTVNRALPSDCVSFKTNYIVNLIELSWNSTDDLDLSVEEPNGDVIDNFNKASESGSLNSDDNANDCRGFPFGRESISYGFRKRALIQAGTYKVKVVHFNKCKQNSNTEWRLRVHVDENEVLFKTGVSDSGLRTVITEQTFSVS